MAAQLLGGRAVSSAMLAELRSEVVEFGLVHGRRPVLATVLVGDDPASHTYVRMKVNRCGEVGIQSRRLDPDAKTDSEELCRVPTFPGCGEWAVSEVPHHVDEGHVRV